MFTSHKTSAVGIEQILPESLAYQPLGVKIRKYEYRFPERFIIMGGTRDGSITAVRRYLDAIRERIDEGKFNLEIADSFFDDLGITNANAESFKALDMLLWREFEKTCRMIAKILLKTNGKSRGEVPSEFHESGLMRAENFLRSLAYNHIPGDDEHVWGYATPGVNALKIGRMPGRCGVRYEDMDALRVMYRLMEDLKESFDRRDNPNPYAPAIDQCSEPIHPARYRTEASINGPAEAPEQSEVVFTSDGSLAQLEYGRGYQYTKQTPVQFDWEIAEYNCRDTVPLETEMRGQQFIIRTPKVLDDKCVATVKLRMTGPYYEEVSARQEVRILNTINEPPEIVNIAGTRRSKGIGPATLLATVRDPNGDPIKFNWKEIKGPPLRFEGDANTAQVKFYHEKVARDRVSTVEISVTDEPQGIRPGAPVTVTGNHRLTIVSSGSEAALQGLLDDEKRKGAQGIARATGGDPFRIATPETLLDDLIDAAMPDEPVERIDIVLLIDSSMSMRDDVETLKSIGPELTLALKAKIKNGDAGKIRIGITSYIYNTRTVHTPLKVIDDRLVMEKIEDVVALINSESNGIETIWDALYLTIDKERWTGAADAHRVVVYLTDEGGDPGTLRKTDVDVARLSNRKQVAFEPVFLQRHFDADEVLMTIRNHINGLSSDNHKADAIKDGLAPMIERQIEKAIVPILAAAKAEKYFPHISETAMGIRDTKKKLDVADKTLGRWITDKDEKMADIAQKEYGKILLTISDEAERMQKVVDFSKRVSDKAARIDMILLLAGTLTDPAMKAEVLKDHYLPELSQSFYSFSSEPGKIANEDWPVFLESVRVIADAAEDTAFNLAARFYPFVSSARHKLKFMNRAASLFKDQRLVVSWILNHYWSAIMRELESGGAEKFDHTELISFAAALTATVDSPQKAIEIANATLLPLSQGKIGVKGKGPSASGVDALFMRAAKQGYDYVAEKMGKGKR